MKLGCFLNSSALRRGRSRNLSMFAFTLWSESVFDTSISGFKNYFNLLWYVDRIAAYQAGVPVVTCVYRDIVAKEARVDRMFLFL